MVWGQGRVIVRFMIIRLKVSNLDQEVNLFYLNMLTRYTYTNVWRAMRVCACVCSSFFCGVCVCVHVLCVCVCVFMVIVVIPIAT